MTISVSDQRAYVPIVQSGLTVTAQRAYVPIVQSGLTVTAQRAYVPIVVVSGATRRRNMSMASGA